MNVILILLAASLIIAVGFLAAFIWSVKNGQYEDDYTPSVRMLFDDKQSEVISGDGIRKNSSRHVSPSGGTARTDNGNKPEITNTNKK